MSEPSFGTRLRTAREKRGWSRYRLLLKVRETVGDPKLLSENTIKLIEQGKTLHPHATTCNILGQVLTELSETVPN